MSMDGKGRWTDKGFVERLWRRVKNEGIFLTEYGSMPALEAGLEAWFNRSNTWRPHEALGNRTPSEVHAARETRTATPAKDELTT